MIIGNDTLEVLIQHAVAAELATPARRTLLLGVFTPGMRATLRVHDLPVDQLRSDVTELNTRAPLDGSLPALVRWLSVATAVAAPGPEREAFRSILEPLGYADEVAGVHPGAAPLMRLADHPRFVTVQAPDRGVFMLVAPVNAALVEQIATDLRVALPMEQVVVEACAPADWPARAKAALADYHSVVTCVGATAPPMAIGLSDLRTVLVPLCLPAARSLALPDWLAARTRLDWPANPAHAGPWCAALAELVGQPAPAGDAGVWADRNPYRGLLIFDAEHQHDFFGRRADTARLMDHLRARAARNHRFIPLVGASGSGKSSLVQAGLIPTLQTHGLGDGAGWQAVVLRASDTPINSLANALIAQLTLDEAESGDLEARLRENPVVLHNLLAQRPGNTRCLLVLDQAEELFAYRDDAVRKFEAGLSAKTSAEARAEALAATLAPFDTFIAALVDAGTRSDGRATVLLALRADHLHRFLEHDAALQDAVSAGEHILPTLRPDALRIAIAHPAQSRGRYFEPRLIDEMLRAMRNEPGQLPLLQFALDLLWRRAPDALLDWQTYDSIGQLKGAIARHAEEVVLQLVEHPRVQIRLTFEALISLGEGAPDTRRRVPKAHLSEALRPVAEALAGGEARLLTTSQVDGVQQIELAHEALIREWETLKAWVKQSRDQIRYERRVETAARLFETEGHLWQGAQLLTLHERMPQMKAERSPSPGMLRFYEKSWRARVRRRRGTAAVVGVISAVVIGLGLVAWVQGQAARAQGRVAAQRLTQGLSVARRIGVRVQNELTTSRDVPKLRTLLLGDMRELIEALDPEREHAGAEELQATRLRAEARTLMEAGQLPEAQTRAEQALTIDRRLAERSDDPDAQRQLSVSLNLLGDLARARGDLEGVQSAYAAALAIRKALAARDPSNTQWQRDLSISHSKLGDLAGARGDLEGVQSAYAAALAIGKALAARDPSNTQWQRGLSISHNQVGDLARARGDLEGAQSAYAAAHAIGKALAARDPSNTAWQRDLSASHSKLGDLARARGDLEGAQSAFAAALAIGKALAARDPSNTDWQRDLSASHSKLGDLARARGDLEGAQSAHAAALAIGKALAARDPSNTTWQRDLSISHSKLGDLARARGDLEGAQSAHAAALAIGKALAARDPSNTPWQRGLSISHNRLGDLARARGDLEGAESAHTAALAIAKALAARDPSNTEWQRDLSISHSKLGDLARARGDLEGAQSAHTAALAIGKALAARDPSNTQWRRGLSISHNQLGDLARARGDVEAAQSAYAAALAIGKALAARDPSNTDWQRDLSISHNQVGDLARARGDLEGAQSAYAAAHAIGKALAARDPSNTAWQRDLSVSHKKLGDLAVAQKDFATARVHLKAALAIAARIFEQAGERGEPTRALVILRLRGMQLEAQAGDESAAMAHLAKARELLVGIDARGEFKGDAQLDKIRAFMAGQPPTD